jgi:hypothetical protein
VPSFSHSVELAQPPEAVFPWLLEQDKVPRWTSDLARYEAVTPRTIKAFVARQLKPTARVVTFGVPGDKVLDDVPKSTVAEQSAEPQRTPPD